MSDASRICHEQVDMLINLHPWIIYASPEIARYRIHMPTARAATDSVATYRICSIRRCSRIVAAPPNVLNEIVAALEY